MTDLEILTRHYIECLVWADKPEDYEDDEISNELRERAERDCANFCFNTHGLINGAIEFEQAGHDFWLSRQRHGSGFWDREEFWGENKDKLDKIAVSFGELCVYVGDDGLLYSD